MRKLQQKQIPAQTTKLDAGDFAFQGNGPDGTVQVGVERKTIGDLVSSLREGRLQGLQTTGTDRPSGQLPRLQEAYDVPYLLVEGDWTTDRQGRLCWRKLAGNRPIPGQMTADGLHKALLSITTQGGLTLIRTTSEAQTVQWLASAYLWWRKEWDQHQTLKTTFRRHGLTPVSQFQEVVMPLGLGLAESKAVEHFCRGSLDVLWDCEAAELREVVVKTTKGPRRLGVKGNDLFDSIRKLRAGGQ